jgi:hypothetical protein
VRTEILRTIVRPDDAVVLIRGLGIVVFRRIQLSIRSIELADPSGLFRVNGAVLLLIVLVLRTASISLVIG